MTDNFLSESNNRNNPDSLSSLNLSFDTSTSINSNPVIMTPTSPKTPTGKTSTPSNGSPKVPEVTAVKDATDRTPLPTPIKDKAMTDMVTKPASVLKSTHDASQMSITTPRKKQLPKNPYHLKKGLANEGWRLNNFDEFKIFINKVKQCIDILTKHHDYTSEAWYFLWQEWLKDDLITADTLHMIAVTVDHPVDTVQSHRSVAKHILTQLPCLTRYVTIPMNTRENDPLCYVNMPHIVDKSAHLQNNLFQALANDDDTMSVSEME